MIITVFVLLLIMTVLADKRQRNASINAEDYSQYDKSGKKYSKEFSKYITDKIIINHLLMTHLLLRQSVARNNTKSDFLDNNLVRKGRDDLLQNIMMSTSQQGYLKFNDSTASNNNDIHENTKPKGGKIYLKEKKNLDIENNNKTKKNESKIEAQETSNSNKNESEKQSQKTTSKPNISQNPNQKPVHLPIIIQQPILLTMPHLFPMYYLFGANIIFQRPPLKFITPPNIVKTRKIN